MRLRDRFRLLASSTVLAALACTAGESAPAAARPAPWVEFMRSPALVGWLDTTRLAPEATEVATVLSIDYARATRVTDDTTVRYTRMDWRVGLRCSAGQLEDRGITLFDGAGRQVKAWPGTPGWVPMRGHVTGTTTQWACRRLHALGRSAAVSRGADADGARVPVRS